jgi:hypothetical protein
VSEDAPGSVPVGVRRDYWKQPGNAAALGQPAGAFAASGSRREEGSSLGSIDDLLDGDN